MLCYVVMQAAEQLRRRGKPLVAALPEDTTGVLMALCTGRLVAHALRHTFAEGVVDAACWPVARVELPRYWLN